MASTFVSASLFQPPIISFTEMANSLTEVQQAHAHMLKTGLFHHDFAASRLLTSAAAAGTITTNPQTLSYTHSIFGHIESPNSYTYNALIRAYAKSPTAAESGFHFFRQMLCGPVSPDEYTFTFALKACAGFGGLEEGKQIHGQVLKIGIGCDLFVQNTMIRVYAKSGRFEFARNVLDRMPERDAVSWNAMLSAYVEIGLMEQAFELFDEMEERNVESWNFMISGYIGVGKVEEARGIFDNMLVKDLVAWNSMITGYADANSFDEVLTLMEKMQSEKVKADNCILANVLSACAREGALSHGEWIHAYIEKNGIELNGILATAVVDMYCKCGNVEKALETFRIASRKDVSTWNSIISGLSRDGFGERALQIFRKMLWEGFKPDEVTFVAILSACSGAGLLKEGREMFDLMLRVYGIQPTVEHYRCMVDLLGRAGLLEEAEELVMGNMSIREAPAVWETLLSACRSHGNIELAEHVSQKLVELNP